MTRFLFTLIAICGIAAPVCGQATTTGREIEIGGNKAVIPDVMVVDHQGRLQRLYSDMIKDKVVLVHFFYTRCTYTCSLQGQDLRELQTLLGSRLGKEVFLISISMDPGNDRPRKLNRWAKSFGVKRGWKLVSSDSIEIKRFLKVMTGNSGPVETHAAPVFIGNDKSRVWTAVDGLSGAGNLARAVEHVLSVSPPLKESKF